MAVQQISGAPSTRAEWVDQRVRTAILTGELTPGARLVTTQLAEELGVSATPLRESLRRLAADGLVDLPAHGVARVSELSAQDAEEVYELRLRLEPDALARSIRRSDGTHRDEVAAAYQALEQVATPAEALEAHRAFHAALISRCDSRWLLRLCALLADHATRYALASTPARGSRGAALDEHRGLRDAVLAGDAEGAEALLTAHLERSRRAVT
jgi:DNA-binding GntR family transcriptional regulator